MEGAESLGSRMHAISCWARLGSPVSLVLHCMPECVRQGARLKAAEGRAAMADCQKPWSAQIQPKQDAKKMPCRCTHQVVAGAADGAACALHRAHPGNTGIEQARCNPKP